MAPTNEVVVGAPDISAGEMKDQVESADHDATAEKENIRNGTPLNFCSSHDDTDILHDDAVPAPSMLERQSDTSQWHWPGAFLIFPGGSNGRLSSTSSLWGDLQPSSDDAAMAMEEAGQPLDNSGLSQAWPVEAPVITAVATAVEPQRDKRFCRTSVWIFLFGSCLSIAALASCTSILLLFAKDPDRPEHMQRRQTIMDAFGEDYFDTTEKEKALHWIVYEDPRNGLGVEEKGHHNNLVQRFSLVSFYLQTSYREPWTACNPPREDPSENCFYTDKSTQRVESWASRWLTAAHECDWMGVACVAAQRSVSELKIWKNNLQGPIPGDEIAMLTHLRELSLNANNLSGSLPIALFESTLLQNVLLKSNALTGEIPAQAFLMPNVDILQLSGNLFTGSIPEEVASFSGHFLNFQGNSLVGSIPDKIYKVSSLKNLLLNNNKVTGSLPSALGSMKKLTSLGLGGNPIEGSIPSEIGLLELTTLQLDRTSMRGTIPEELYNNQGLSRLQLSGTQFSGTISKRVGRLKYLEVLHIADTGLHGTVPEELSSLHGLREFHLNGNANLLGSIPDKICHQKIQRYEIVADCAYTPPEGIAAMFCPKGCCSTCCFVSTKICLDM